MIHDFNLVRIADPLAEAYCDFVAVQMVDVRFLSSKTVPQKKKARVVKTALSVNVVRSINSSNVESRPAPTRQDGSYGGAFPLLHVPDLDHGKPFLWVPRPAAVKDMGIDALVVV